MDEVFPGIYLVEENDEGGGWRELTWFVDTPEGGLLVDPQSFGPATAKAIDRLGGAKTIVVTHALSMGDACKFKERYRARLIAHRAVSPLVKGCAVDLMFDSDFSILQGVRALHAGVPSPGSAMLYIMRDRGYLFSGDFLVISGGRGPPALQLREGGDASLRRRMLLHLKALRFEAVMPFRTRHETANYLSVSAGPMADALMGAGSYAPRPA